MTMVADEIAEFTDIDLQNICSCCCIACELQISQLLLIVITNLVVRAIFHGASKYRWKWECLSRPLERPETKHIHSHYTAPAKSDRDVVFTHRFSFSSLTCFSLLLDPEALSECQRFQWIEFQTTTRFGLRIYRQGAQRSCLSEYMALFGAAIKFGKVKG